MAQTPTSIAQLLIQLRRLSGAPNASQIDPEIRRVRDAFKNACVEALTTNYEAAQAGDVERKLWRFAFYAVIRDFRERLKEPAPAATAASAASPAAKLRAKTLAAYLKFLQDSEALYEKLADHFRAAAAANGTPTSTCRRLRASLARSLICVGDLRRYAATASASAAPPPDDTQQQQQQVDWSNARAAYAAAAGADPSAGNAFNQLGVLDEAEGASLTAAFFYLRAWQAGSPFAAAKQNAQLLFGAVQSAPEGQTPQKGGKRAARPMALLESELSFSYLRLYAFLFERVDVDATPRRMTPAAADFEELVNRLKQQSNAGGAGAATRRVGQAAASALVSVAAAVAARPIPPPLLIVAVGLLLIRAAEASISPANDQHQGNDAAAAAAASAAKCYTLSVVLDVLGRLSTAASKLKLGDAAPLCDGALVSPLLPAAAVAVRWLAAAEAAPALPGGAAPAAVEATVDGLQENRAAAWRGLTALVSGLADSPAVRTSTQQLENDAAPVPLPEDLFFAGFPPLEAPENAENEQQWAQLDAAAAAAATALTKDPSTASAPGRRRAVRLWNDLQALAAAAGAWGAAHGSSGAATDFDIAAAAAEFVQAAATAAIAARKGRSSTPAASKRSEGGSKALPTGPASAAAAGKSGEAPADQHQAMDEDEEEEVILFAPTMGPRRVSSAALLSGSSGRGTPAPTAPGEAAPVPAAMDVDVAPSAAPVASPMGPTAAAAAPTTAPLLPLDLEQEDPQAAMERTFHDMAAQVLGSDDAEIGFGAVSTAPPPPPMPTFLGAPSPAGMAVGGYSGAHYGAATPSQLFPGAQGGFYPGGGAAWPSGGPSPLAAPPLAVPSLPPPPIAAGQHPAEGLRAVLFGGAAPAAGVPPPLGEPIPPPPEPGPGLWGP